MKVDLILFVRVFTEKKITIDDYPRCGFNLKEVKKRWNSSYEEFSVEFNDKFGFYDHNILFRFYNVEHWLYKDSKNVSDYIFNQLNSIQRIIYRLSQTLNLDGEEETPSIISFINETNETVLNDDFNILQNDI